MTYRLLKVVVQPVLVKDDGDTLTERVVEVSEVSAKDWPDYPARLEQQIEALGGTP
jgi:hypothetical protein